MSCSRLLHSCFRLLLLLSTQPCCLAPALRLQVDDLTCRLFPVQAIGAEGVIPAQCRSLVKQYLPQIIKIIATMPVDQVSLVEQQSQQIKNFQSALQSDGSCRPLVFTQPFASPASSSRSTCPYHLPC